MQGTQDESPLPISLLTGFLGSGKTTLLRRALGSPRFADTAVVINEIGEIGLDHHLVETVAGPVLELPGGCICCAVREDLAATLRALLARRDEGRGTFRRLVIETTGLADPGPILFTLAAEPALERRLRLDRVVTTIDATTGPAVLARYPEAVAQLAVADRVVITKTDLARATPELIAAIDSINAQAQQTEAAKSPDIADMLWGAAGERVSPQYPTAQPARHTHGIATYALQLSAPCSRLEFARALGTLARDRGEDLLRVKGLMRFSDKPDAIAFVQAAQHALYPPIWLDEHRHRGEGNRLQFVVRDMALDEIISRFAFAGAKPIQGEMDSERVGEACWT